MAFRLSTVPLSIDNFQQKIAQAWSNIEESGNQGLREDSQYKLTFKNIYILDDYGLEFGSYFSDK
jgi:hypothetical protein